MDTVAGRDRLLWQSAFYAATPMLLVDSSRRVVEINAALRELLRTDVAGVKGHDIGKLLSRLDAKLQTALVDMMQRMQDAVSSESRVIRKACEYCSPRFGEIDVELFAVPCTNSMDGHIDGWTVNVELTDSQTRLDFMEALEARWVHEIMWEAYASSYDKVLPRMPFYDEVVKRHLKALSSPHIKAVLDVGGGTGNVAIPLAEQGKQVTVVDVGRAMLEKLNSKLEVSGLEGITVIEDTAERIDQLADASFDGVNALLSFFDMDSPRRALTEAVRVLSPGGVIAITDPKDCFDVDQLLGIAEDHLRNQGLLGELGKDWQRVKKAGPELDDRIQSTQSGDAVENKGAWHARIVLEELKSLGFRDLTMSDSHHGNCATIIGKKPGATGG